MPLDPLHVAGHALGLQHRADELNIVGIVFEMEHLQRRRHERVPLPVVSNMLPITFHTSRRWLVDDSPKQTELFYCLHKLFEVDRFDDIGVCT